MLLCALRSVCRGYYTHSCVFLFPLLCPSFACAISTLLQFSLLFSSSFRLIVFFHLSFFLFFMYHALQSMKRPEA